MKTDLKDIKKRTLKIGDTIAWCSWNYNLKNFGKKGDEYWFHKAIVYFERGKVRASNDEIPELCDTDFLIIERNGLKMIEVDNDWDWSYGEHKPDPELLKAIENFKRCIFVDSDGGCSIRIAQ